MSVHVSVCVGTWYVPMLLKLGREVTREKGHLSLWSRKGMRRQVSLAPAKGGRGKHPDYPSRKGFIGRKKVFWPNCIQNWEEEDVPFPLVTNTP